MRTGSRPLRTASRSSSAAASWHGPSASDSRMSRCSSAGSTCASVLCHVKGKQCLKWLPRSAPFPNNKGTTSRCTVQP